MIRSGLKSRTASAFLARVCAICPSLLAALLALQTAALPLCAIAAWLPQSQRESESESSAPEESSKATDPHALVTAASARARRARADRMARLEHFQTRMEAALQVAQVRPTHSAEQAGRNGSGCALRC